MMHLQERRSIIFIFPLVLLPCGCGKDHESPVIQVQLKQKIFDENFEADFVDVLRPLVADSLKYPKFYTEKLSQFKGIPKLDSFYTKERKTHSSRSVDVM